MLKTDTLKLAKENLENELNNIVVSVEDKAKVEEEVENYRKSLLEKLEEDAEAKRKDCKVKISLLEELLEVSTQDDEAENVEATA